MRSFVDRYFSDDLLQHILALADENRAIVEVDVLE